MGRHTSSTKLIMEKTLALFDRITNQTLLTRRLTISANRLLPESEVNEAVYAEQLTMFENVEDVSRREEDEAREKRIQRAMIDIKGRFGPNAILKGTSYQDAATGIERNQSIGGHHE